MEKKIILDEIDKIMESIDDEIRKEQLRNLKRQSNRFDWKHLLKKAEKIIWKTLDIQI